MKRLSLFSLLLVGTAMITSCSSPPEGALFNKQDLTGWQTTGDVKIEEGVMRLSGPDAQAIFKQGNYHFFDLTVEMRTTNNGKGTVMFHTDKQANKGYGVAINNNHEDAEWWKMTGSLLSVRQLTKSVAKENEWFTLHLRVVGPTITIHVNDYPVVEYIESATAYRIAPHTAARLSEGTFALASSGSGTIEVKAINVQVLHPDRATLDELALLSATADEQHDEIIRLHQEDFPVLDYHVHLKGGLTKESAAAQSRQKGINYAIAPNCGIGFPITTDEEVIAYLDTMRSQPCILAMQAEGREWVTTFTPEVRAQFDFVFTDALTFTDDKGRRTRLWIPEETWIEDEESYMDVIVDRICQVLQEPFDVYVNPCFLPEPMDQRAEALWTEERMNKFIEALAKSGKALEINPRYKIPHQAIIAKAKAAGVKFTFGTNNAESDLGLLEYAVTMKKACHITAEEMYHPKVKN